MYDPLSDTGLTEMGEQYWWRILRALPMDQQHELDDIAAQVHALTIRAQELVAAIPQPYPVGRAVRPLQLLTLVGAHDMKLQDAAVKIGISVQTANQQMATARARFRCGTTTGAVYRAVKAGLM